MDLRRFEEQIFFSTVRISAVEEESGKESGGTGFLVAQPISNVKSVILLVTCKHVLFGGRGRITLHLHRKSAELGSGPALENPIVVGPATYNKSYHEHPNPKIDIAAVNLSVVFDREKDVFHKHIGIDVFATFTETDLVPGMDVVFVGYPLRIYDEKHNLPVLRSGRVASLPKVDFKGEPEFLIDAQVFPGSSGSPLFGVLGRKWRFLGVVGETFWRLNPVELLEVAVVPAAEQVIGLGVVYKAKNVSDVIELVARKF